MLIALCNGEELRHLNFRKIGVNCRCVRKRTFKHNDMPMAHVIFYNNIYAILLSLSECHTTYLQSYI